MRGKEEEEEIEGGEVHMGEKTRVGGIVQESVGRVVLGSAAVTTTTTTTTAGTTGTASPS